jgi:hypothetical protein
MTNFLIQLREWIKNPKHQRNLTIVLAIIVVLLIRRCSPSQGEINSLKQNVFALNDSIRTYKTKNGQLIYEKGAIISENGSLKDYNRALYEEIKYLKDNPIVVIKPEIKIVEVPKYIPIYIKDPIKNSDGSITRTLDWSYDTTYSIGNFRKIYGDFKATVDSSLNLTTSPMHISRDEFGMALTTGLTENKEGLLEIFVTSKYPGFSVTNLDGSLIDPAKSEVLKKYFPPKRWAIGVYGGFGPYIDPFNVKIGMGVQLGIGLQYNIIQWNFKK